MLSGLVVVALVVAGFACACACVEESGTVAIRSPPEAMRCRIRMCFRPSLRLRCGHLSRASQGRPGATLRPTTRDAREALAVLGQARQGTVWPVARRSRDKV